MKAAVYYNNQDVRLEDYADPVIGPGELKIKIDSCGLCGGDTMEWYLAHKAPIVLGHEPTGVVAEVGQGVIGFKPGDRVFVHHHVACMSCHYCRRGYFTMCEKFTQTHIYPGAFAEYVRVPADNVRHDVHILPDSVSLEEDRAILIVIVKGIDNIIPTGPSTHPQKTSERKTTSVERPSPLPMYLGSTILPITMLKTR